MSGTAHKLIDADTHVSENEQMWEHIEREMYQRRPVLISLPDNTLYGDRNAMWLIDGNIFPKPAGKGGFALITPSAAKKQQTRTDISAGCREITDPEARLRDMDRSGFDVQVIYPTLFLIYLTDDVALEVALCRAYNRWMAEACAKGKERLKWVVIRRCARLRNRSKNCVGRKNMARSGSFSEALKARAPSTIPIFSRCIRKPAISICRFAFTRAPVVRRSSTFSIWNATASGPIQRSCRCSLSTTSSTPINASFFLRLQFLTCASAAFASSRVGNSSNQTS